MGNQFIRTEMLLGKDSVDKLKKSKVIIFGIGGVGSYVAEGLARTGVGNITLVDKDDIDETNINRQIHATNKTVGKSKVEVMKERILDINPDCNVEVYQEFFMPESEDIFDQTFDYVVDCVDTVTAKIEIIMRAEKYNVKVISAMGTGNKLDPTKLEVSDIYKTEVCPLAKVMRKELKARDVKKLKVVYSKEEPIQSEENYEHICKDGVCVRKSIVSSVVFVPATAGLIIVGEIVKDIIKG